MAIASIVGLVWLGEAGQVEAQCGTLAMDSNASFLVAGIDSYGNLGICELEPGAPPSYTPVFEKFTAIAGCNAGTSSVDPIEITGTDGDDRVAPLMRTITCAGHSLSPFPASFSFGFVVEGGKGYDFLQGTPNADVLYSNNASSDADATTDQLCGYAGNDTLVGDKDNSSSHNEIMSGGAGSSDACYGINTTTPIHDLGYSCEVYSTPIDFVVDSGAECAWATDGSGNPIPQDIVWWL